MYRGVGATVRSRRRLVWVAGVVAVCASVLVQAGLAHNLWNAAAEFSDSANPAPDHDTNPGVWSYLEGPISGGQVPSGYVLMSDAGANVWRSAAPDGFGTPAIQRPTTELVVHPAADRYAIVGWKSPITGTVPVSGSVTDVDANCGDGVAWWINQGATNLASGSIANGGTQAFSAGTGGSGLTSVAITAGDVLYFIVGPGSTGSTAHFCDSTGIDVTIGSGATAATGVSIRLLRTQKGVLVRWRTASELDVLGFNVLREANGRRVRVNERLIPALHRAGGAYSILDRRAPRQRAGVRYWIQSVDADGARTVHGPSRPIRTA